MRADELAGGKNAEAIMGTAELLVQPMLLGGDELGRTQRGNNNAYCQDNEISWFDWADIDDDLLAFTSALVAVPFSTLSRIR